MFTMNMLKYEKIIQLILLVFAILFMDRCVKSIKSPIIMKSIILPYNTMPLSTMCVHDNLWITSYGRQSILIFDSTTGILIKELKDSFLPAYMVNDEISHRIFLSSPVNKGIEVIDSKTLKTEQIISTSDNFNRLIIADGFLYACALSSPKLYKINITKTTLENIYSLPQVGFYAAITKDKIYIASALEATEDNPAQNESKIIIINKKDGTVLHVINIPGRDVQCLAWDNDNYIYTASNTNGRLVRINIQKDTIDKEYNIAINRAFDILIDVNKNIAFISTEGINTLYIISLKDKQILNQQC